MMKLMMLDAPNAAKASVGDVWKQTVDPPIKKVKENLRFPPAGCVANGPQHENRAFLHHMLVVFVDAMSEQIDGQVQEQDKSRDCVENDMN